MNRSIRRSLISIILPRSARSGMRMFTGVMMARLLSQRKSGQIIFTASRLRRRKRKPHKKNLREGSTEITSLTNRNFQICGLALRKG